MGQFQTERTKIMNHGRTIETSYTTTIELDGIEYDAEVEYDAHISPADPDVGFMEDYIESVNIESVIIQKEIIRKDGKHEMMYLDVTKWCDLDAIEEEIKDQQPEAV